MLELFIIGGLGLFTLGSRMSKIADNRERREAARKAGKTWYHTNDCHIRAVDDNSFCEMVWKNQSWLGHDTMIKLKSGIPVQDITKEKAMEYNKQLEDAGKMYYYEEDTRNSWVPVDKENGRPFSIDIYDDLWGDRHIMVYYLNKDEKGHIKKFDYSHMESKELKTVEEINSYTLPGRNLSEQDIDIRTCSRLYQRTKSLIEWNFPVERGF